MKRVEIQKVEITDEHYPNLLKLIPDPPKTLYYRGDISIANLPSIAIVGARKASAYGRWAAHRLAQVLADYEIVTVSGMAYGIDACAHQGALEQDGKTIAVFGCGVDICYPAAHEKLLENIIAKGLVISEYQPGVPPLPYHFPQRNRIISGLSYATVVAEAGLHSGSLITAELAAEQGRNIYAVPGNINSKSSIGANKLIKDGAIPLIVIEDILDELGVCRKSAAEQKVQLGKDEKQIYEQILKQGEVTADFLFKATGMKVSTVNSIVTILEMKGLVQTALGKIFIAK